MSTKTRRKGSAARRKNTPAKPQQTPAPAPADTRAPLPTRPDWINRAEQAEARAALDAAWYGLTIPVRSWKATPHGGATTTVTLSDPATTDTDVPITIRHTGADGRVGEITATIHCPSGIPHLQRLTRLADLKSLHDEGTSCCRHHGGKNAHQALTGGVHATPRLEPVKTLVVPNVQPVKVHPLPEGIRRTTAAADETQPIPVLKPAPAADTDALKEHPDHG